MIQRAHAIREKINRFICRHFHQGAINYRITPNEGSYTCPVCLMRHKVW